MPFPIAIVGSVVGVVGVVGTVAAVSHEDHSDHSDYSDRAYREEQARKKREEERVRNLAAARKEMDNTLQQMKKALADEIREQGLDPEPFLNWVPSSEDFSFTDFDKEYAQLDSLAKTRIRQLVDMHLEQEIRERQKELDAINELIRKVNETRLTGK